MPDVRGAPTPLPLEYGPVASRLAPIGERADGLLKLLALAATVPLVLIFFMKFTADLAIAHATSEPSILWDYNGYWWQARHRDPILLPRFAGTYLVYYVARGIEAVIGIPQDFRLHPIRLAAALVSVASIWAGTAPVLFGRRESAQSDWRIFYAGYLLLAALSFYVYMPYDLTSLAFISAAWVLVLQRRRLAVLVLLVVCGLFRESNLHIAWFAVATLLVPSLSVGVGWAAAYLAAFFAEWWVLHRVVWPNARPQLGALDAMRSNLTSLTSWAVVALIGCMALIALVVVARRVRRAPADGSRLPPLEALYLIHIAAVPAWLLFYAANGASWSEFRVQLPTLLPLVYAVAWRGQAGDDRGLTTSSA
jgi:hypothetical protein